MNTDLLIQLYSIHSPSYGEKKLVKFIKKYLRSIGVNNFFCEKGNMYITKGNAETYPCVVAHLDQVQRKHSKNFTCVIADNIIFATNGKEKSSDEIVKNMVLDYDYTVELEGLGADDKNGIWVALECLKTYDNIKVAFFMGEEVGCVGSNNAKMDFFDDCRFAIQCDRRNGGDFIYDVCGQMCSEEFMVDTHLSEFGYKLCHGLSTDVATLSSKGLGISCVNLSCGYYNPHTDEEYTNLDELNNCLNFVKYIIENCTKVYKHKLERDSWFYGNYFGYYGGSYGYKNKKSSSSKKSSIDENEEDETDSYLHDYEIMEDIILNEPGIDIANVYNNHRDSFINKDIDILTQLYDEINEVYYGYFYDEDDIVAR